ncbi:MAG: tetratricopeptide repeat protein [Bryobacteraceae bacterium]
MRTDRFCLAALAAALAVGAGAHASETGHLRPGESNQRLSTDQRIAALEKRIENDRNNVRPQNELAAAYLQKVRETVDFGYLDRAERILSHVLEMDDGNYEALRMREIVELERHHFDAAASMAEALAVLHPSDSWNYGVLGDSAMEMGDYTRASRAYERMLSLRPDQSSLNRVAWFEFVMGRPERAILLMKQAVNSGAASPENTAWCLVELGNLYFKTGALTDAGRSYEQAARTFPGYHAAEAGLGRMRAAEGNDAEAIGHYRKAQGSVPLPDYTAALETLYTLSAQPAKAREQRELLDFTDRMARVAAEKTNRNLALIYADEGRNLDRAMELVDEELKVRKDVYTFDARAWVLFQRHDYAAAEAESRKALNHGTPEPAFYYHAGRIAAALGKKDQARELLRRALNLNPKFDLKGAAAAATLLQSL